MIKITQLKLIELNDYARKFKSFNWCQECGGNIIFISETGESVCQECGLVVNERAIDLSHSDKVIYTSQEVINKEHFGSLVTPLTPELALHTIIPIKEIRNSDLKRAAKWNTRISWNEKNILIATKELKRMSSNLSLPNYVKISAVNVYKKAFKMNLIKGRSINTMIAACIYYACRNLKVNRTLQEILDECNCSERELRGHLKVLVKLLNLKIPMIDFISLIPKYIAILNLNREIENLVINLLEPIKDSMYINGKDPKGLVAGALYLVCNLKKIQLTQQQISKVVGISELTIRSRYKELLRNRTTINLMNSFESKNFIVREAQKKVKI